MPARAHRAIRPLVVDVALAPTLLPPDAQAYRDTIYVVIDVVRATTTICVLFERGCRQVLVASSIAAAREARAALGPDWLLAGEVEGARPPGFDFGNSPAEFAMLDLAGRGVICATTNGTRALRACAGGRAVFSGSLRNAESIANTLAAERLERQADVVFVCAGRDGRPAYDDTVCAGYLARSLLHAVGPERIVLDENARMACDLLAHVEATVGIEAALRTSDAGQAVERIGLGADIALCATTNAASVLPALSGMYLDTDLYVVEDTARRPHE
jgi:2-phosphosulfolactate phosphatase